MYQNPRFGECTAEIRNDKGKKVADLRVVSTAPASDTPSAATLETRSKDLLQARGSSPHTMDPNIQTEIAQHEEMDNVAFNGLLANIIAAMTFLLDQSRPAKVDQQLPGDKSLIEVFPAPERQVVISKEVMESLVDVLEFQCAQPASNRPLAIDFRVMNNGPVVWPGSISHPD